MLLLRHYKTQLLGCFNAFWSYSRGRGLTCAASRGFFTDITRARNAHDVRGGAGACACMCAGARACVCARIRMTPP